MYNIGIDLGGTNIKVGVVNDDFKIVGKSNIKTDLPRPAEEIADSIAKGVELACNEAGIDVKDINSIGIGTPGVADRNTGVVLYSCNLGFNNTDLGGLLKHRLGTDIYVENDANVAAYGEVLGGAVQRKERCNGVQRQPFQKSDLYTASARYYIADLCKKRLLCYR